MQHSFLQALVSLL